MNSLKKNINKEKNSNLKIKHNRLLSQAKIKNFLYNKVDLIPINMMITIYLFVPKKLHVVKFNQQAFVILNSFNHKIFLFMKKICKMNRTYKLNQTDKLNWILFQEDLNKINFQLQVPILIEYLTRYKGSDKSPFPACRICSKMINSSTIKPCQCQEPRKFVHEDCLKKQVLKNYKHLFREATCKYCDTKYKMKVIGVKKFMPSLGWEESKDKYPLLCLLATFFFILLMAILVALQLNSVLQSKTQQDGFFNSPITLISLEVFMLLMLLLLGWFIAMILKNMMFIEKIYQWNILDYEEYPEKPVYQHPKKDNFNFLQQNVEIDQQGILKVKQASVVQSQETPPLRKSKTAFQKNREDEGNMFGILSEQQAAMLTRQKKKQQMTLYYSAAPKNKKKDSKKSEIRGFSDEDQ